ncbi:MAG: FAD-binding protein [Armatimonadetes bacterium]|nr:FAD-binding protein [Armatimonadota bacterium]
MISKTVKNKLRAILGKENLLDEKEDLICYSYDATTFQFKPELVIFPKTPEQISEILKIANQEKIPVVPRGGGTGLSGGSIPILGGMALVLTRMNKILEIDQENLTALVEPGVITEEFKIIVEKLGLFYPPDPASMKMSTLGGNAAECAGGPHCLKYGVTRDYVLGLEVVLPTGEIIKIGSKVIKNVTGYDLTRLIIGSEGTLGVITKIILKLIPLPENFKTAIASFFTMEDAAKCVSKIIQARILPSTLEFMDHFSIKAVEEYSHLGLPQEAHALLLIEVDGEDTATKIQLNKIKEICKEENVIEFKSASTFEEREKIWEARRAVSPALGKISPLRLNEDVVVPRNKLTELIKETQSISKQYNLEIANFGHAGDGNLHLNILLKSRTPQVMKNAEEALNALYLKVIQMQGAISGEHGIGFLKSKYLSYALKEEQILLMKKIKTIFDPNNILNPGKIFVD